MSYAANMPLLISQPIFVATPISHGERHSPARERPERSRTAGLLRLRICDGGREDVGKPEERTSADSQILNGAVPLIFPYFFLNM